jgi:hypothetical protein
MEDMDLWMLGLHIQFLLAMLLLGWFLPAVVSYWLCKSQNPRPSLWGRCSANAITCFLVELVIAVVWGMMRLELLGILLGLSIATVAGAAVSKKIMSISFLRAIPISLICLVDMIVIGFYFRALLVIYIGLTFPI